VQINLVFPTGNLSILSAPKHCTQLEKGIRFSFQLQNKTNGSLIRHEIKFFVCLFLWDWGLNSEFPAQAYYSLNHTSSPFCSGYFGDRVLRTSYPCWPGTSVLPISASKVARITGVNHNNLPSSRIFKVLPHHQNPIKIPNWVWCCIIVIIVIVIII
jgi:hypothetical protein